MNSIDDASYRLPLARGYLAKAEQGVREQRWDDGLANAQEAVENAGKAVVSHFRPVPRTHDRLEPLRDLVEQPVVSTSIRHTIRAALDAFHGMGLATHIRAAYGDEASRTPPWDLIQEGEARFGLDEARRAVALAEAVYAEMNRSSTNR